MRLKDSPISSRMESSLSTDTFNTPRRVLLVGSKPRLLKTIQDRLGENFESTILIDPREALSYAAENKVDCGIFEADMPRLNGFDLLLGIRQHDTNFGAILLAKEETFSQARQAFQSGALDLIPQPWKSREITKSLFHALEHRLQQENREMGLDDNVEHLAMQLEKLSVSEAMARTQNDIYAGIIHDIASPISVAQGYLNLLNISLADQKRMTRKGMDKFMERLNKIAQQIQVCSDITRRQSAFINFNETSGRNLVLTEFFDEINGIFAIHPKMRQVKIEVRMPEEEVNLSFHRVDLLQIMLNLVQNAIHASSEGEPIVVEMLTDCDPAKLLSPPEGCLVNSIHFSNLKQMQDPVVLRVQDHGSGIDPNLFEFIFEKNVTTKPPSQGSGLGLSIVDRLIGNAGGAIVVHSTPGEGSAFYLILPRV